MTREELARAICEARGIRADNPTGKTLERDNGEMTRVCAWEQFLPHVDAILAGLAEPSEQMLVEGGMHGGDPKGVWRAMLKAIE